MVNFCSVATCRNSSRNRSDLSFFSFPQKKNARRFWRNFCRRSDPEFRDQASPRICSAHFEEFSIVKSLGGRRDLVPGALPKYFEPPPPDANISQREERLGERKRRSTSGESGKRRHKKKFQVEYNGGQNNDASNVTISEVVLLDHNYCHQTNNRATQTDLAFGDISCLAEEISVLKEEKAKLEAKLADKKRMKRELFMEDVLKNDESVKFYTGIPSLACLMMIFNLLKSNCQRNPGKIEKS